MADNTIVPVRAKSGWIEVDRIDNGGRTIKSKAHVVASHGMFSGKEMEGVMRDVAADLGVSEDRIHVDTYAKGQAPLETNPRHRGLGLRTTAPVKKQTEYIAVKPIKVRATFSGWAAPSTPEEMEAYIAEFNARWKTLADAGS